MELVKLLNITEATSINELTNDQVKELQGALNYLGYPIINTDGLTDPHEREFDIIIYQNQQRSSLTVVIRRIYL